MAISLLPSEATSKEVTSGLGHFLFTIQQAMVAVFVEPQLDIGMPRAFHKLDALAVRDDIVLHSVENQDGPSQLFGKQGRRELVDFLRDAVAHFRIDPLVLKAETPCLLPLLPLAFREERPP